MSAWTVIAHTEVGSGGAANIEFNSISGTYTDLAILISGRSNRANPDDWLTIAFNGSSANYSGRRLYGSGSSVTSDQNALTTVIDSGLIDGNNATASTFASVLVYIPNYAGSTNKSVSIDSVMENNATEAYQLIGASLWSDTAAITSIVLDSRFGGTWQEYSSATLYGILKGSSGGVTVS
jgi:hypothetical protein